MEINEEIGRKIVELRSDKGLTQERLAEIIGVSREMLAYYEGGKRKIKIDILVKTAEYFNVSADYLLGRTSVKTTDTDLKSVCEYIGLSENAVTRIRSAISKDVKSSVLYEGIIVDILDYIDKLKGEKNET